MPQRRFPYSLSFARKHVPGGARLAGLLATADPAAPVAERHLWLFELLQWLRHGRQVQLSKSLGRLRQLLDALERDAGRRQAVVAVLRGLWHDIDAAPLFSDLGFAPRVTFLSELGARLRLKLLPASPATTDLAELFGQLFLHKGDGAWIRAIDDASLDRLAAFFAAETPPTDAVAMDDWRAPLWNAFGVLVSATHAAGLSTAMRRRLGGGTTGPADEPFRQLVRASERVQAAATAGDLVAAGHELVYLRALLQACRAAIDGVGGHLEEHGVSVNIVFEADQIVARTVRIEALLDTIFSPAPQRELARLLADLSEVAWERRSVGALFRQHYSLLARKVAERSAETGVHYITRDRAEYLAMLRAACGGGAVVAGTVFLKFWLLALALPALWSGLAVGFNYAVSFVFIQLRHWTLATKQPAVTAPAMAASLRHVGREAPGEGDDASIERFVDEVAHLLRSQVVGIFGNLVVVAPLAGLVEWLWRGARGTGLVSRPEAEHVVESLSVWGPTPLYAAVTGVLLFASSLVAGWAENGFVFHRLDSAIAWNPGFRRWLGPVRAQRAARWWRNNVSGVAANVSLGLMLGLLAPLSGFIGLPLDVRHVTLSAGQLAAAAMALGPRVLDTAPFWECVAALPVVGALNLGVSFYLAFRVALRSRGIRVAERARVYAAIRRRLWHAPASFLLPPRAGAR